VYKSTPIVKLVLKLENFCLGVG